MRCKTDYKLLIDTVVNEERPFFEDEDEVYDEFNLTDYVVNGCKFKHYDETECPTDRYNDFWLILVIMIMIKIVVADHSI